MEHKSPCGDREPFPLQGTLVLYSAGFVPYAFVCLSLYLLGKSTSHDLEPTAGGVVYPRVAGGCDEVHKRQSKQLWTSRGRAVFEDLLQHYGLVVCFGWIHSNRSKLSNLVSCPNMHGRGAAEHLVPRGTL